MDTQARYPGNGLGAGAYGAGEGPKQAIQGHPASQVREQGCVAAALSRLARAVEVNGSLVDDLGQRFAPVTCPVPTDARSTEAPLPGSQVAVSIGQLAAQLERINANAAALRESVDL